MQLRQDRMSTKERMEALFEHRQPDRVPIGSFATTFSNRNAGHSVETAYNDPERSLEAMLWTAEQYGWDPIFMNFGHTVSGALDFGKQTKAAKVKDGRPAADSDPVKTERDVSNLKMPDPRTAGRIPKVLAFSRLQDKHGLPVSFYSRSPFTMAADICGLERFLAWMKKKPELCTTLLRMAVDHTLAVLEYWVETFGPEKIFTLMSSASESNDTIDPDHFVKYALPYHVEYHGRLRAMGIRRFGLHICGDQNGNLPHLVEASPWPHPSVLSFGHEVDLEVAGKNFPKDIIFGNIELDAIETGTPQQVYELSRTALEKGKNLPGGFVLGPGCHILAAPPVNVFAMTKAVNDFGWYE